MKKVQVDFWQVTVPESWNIESEDEMTSMYDPDGMGTLVISSVVEDEAIGDEYIEDLVIEHLDAGAELHHEVFGPFTGVGCCFEADGDYWCEWYLCHENMLLFVTYNCDLESEGEEDDLIESILDSLTLMKNSKLH
ncbi:hypothetical protein MNBD_GAMMA21-1030 [hydrothermal vent metagenome]|uniref:DUF3805 domain-containing protein n=1 Tax=hydrothermal vent metagenome TaxID=652676 RepID=A0A3B1A8Y1_9ZZZZ